MAVSAAKNASFVFLAEVSNPTSLIAMFVIPSAIDKIQKRKATLTIALSEIDKIVIEYNVDLSDAQKGTKGKVEKPILIISESFE